jgi:hypothetical protein
VCAACTRDAPDALSNPSPSTEDGITRPDENVGDAQEPIAPGLVAACVLAGALIAEHVCGDASYWPDHCPAGTILTITDLRTSTWPRRPVRVSCDLLKELTCGASGVGGGELFKVFCAGGL